MLNNTRRLRTMSVASAGLLKAWIARRLSAELNGPHTPSFTATTMYCRGPLLEGGVRVCYTIIP